MYSGQIKLFSNSAGVPFATAVAKELDINLGQAIVGRFNDGEVRIEIKENVRGHDVFIVGPTVSAESFFEMTLLARAVKGSSAARVTLIIPYLGYNRQDRKDKPRTPISAKVAIEILKLGMPDRALLIDVHSDPTLAHFEPVVTDHLYASIEVVPYLQKILPQPFVVASPDKGGGPRARAYAQHLGEQDYVIFDKTRAGPGTVSSVKIIGDVEGRNVLFVDDMIDTGSTIVADIVAAKEAGAARVFVFATHAVFSGRDDAAVRKVIERLDQSGVEEIIVTDTIYHRPELLKTTHTKLTVCSLTGLINRAVQRLHQNRSLSELFLK